MKDNVRYVLLPQTVKVRKYDVDIVSLQKCLAAHKNMSCNAIAWELNVPVTQIQHYFRTDKYFAIPEPELWYDLKALLNITTTEFDESIMTFVERDGVFDMAERVWLTNENSQTLKAQRDGEKILTQLKPLNTQFGYCRTLKANPGGLTVNKMNMTNTHGITGVMKMENSKNEEWTWDVDGEPTEIRIRKLTPKECWRLMGFDDDSFSRAEQVNSNCQLYKQAGNSICVPVLEAIFSQMM